MINRSRRSPTLLLGLLAVAALLTVFACGDRGELPIAESTVDPLPNAPRLTLLVVVDQLRAETLDLFDAHWSGGFRRLLDEGLVFEQARHAHAVTHTAPGHASLATGCHPRRHGIIANNWIDRQTGDWIYSVGDEVYGRSPKRLDCSTVGEWLKATSPASRVFAASRKDRSAILMAGRGADAAIWYDSGSGGFESTAYYAGAPEWLEESVDAALVARFGQPWTPLEESPDVTALGVRETDMGPLFGQLPRSVGGLSVAPDRGFYSSLSDTPFVDAALARLALRLVDEQALGQRGVADVLALSFSALDSVGHSYGPDSPEAFDTLLRLDRTLGDLIAALEERVGAGQLLVTLSSDHGVMPLPEWDQAGGGDARRVDDGDILCVQGLAAATAEAFGQDGLWLPGAILSEDVLSRTGRSADEVEAFGRSYLESCPQIERVWTRSELLGPVTAERPVAAVSGVAESGAAVSGVAELGVGGPVVDESAAVFHAAFHPRRSPNLLIQYKESFLPTRATAASHGSAWEYDRGVPMILWGAGLAPRRVASPVHTVDLAPTVAELLGIPPPTPLDGRSLLADSLQGLPRR